MVVLALFTASSVTFSQAPRLSLVTGWYPWDPYNYDDQSHGDHRPSGLDVELTRAALRTAGYNLEIVNASWPQQLDALARGTQDLGMGALPGDAPGGGIQYSAPYRTEVIELFVRTGTAGQYAAGNVDELLELLRSRRFRLGVTKAYSYSDAIDRFLADPASDRDVVRVESEYVLFREMDAGRIDGFIADRLVAATIGWRTGFLDLIEPHPTTIATNPVRILFSSKVDPAVVAAFDRAIAELRRNGKYNQIVRHYVMPLLLAQVIDRPWFGALGVLATISLAVSGVVLAYTGGFSIFGACVLAALPAMGGGVLRDLIVGRRPIGIVRDPESFLYVGLTVLAGWIVIRWRDRVSRANRSASAAALTQRWFEWTVTVSDAIGLGTLTVISVLVAMDMRSEPLLLWGPLLAAITNVGGGIMRDLVRGEGGLRTLKGSLYAELTIGWGFALSAFFYWEAGRIDPVEILIAAIGCAAGACLMRILAVQRGISAPMLQRAPRAAEPTAP